MAGTALIDRRRFLVLASSAAVVAMEGSRRALGREIAPTEGLLSGPIELSGDWHAAPTDAVMRVLNRIREVDLSGLRLLSDRQPKKIRIENRDEVTPAIWLHSDQPDMASIVVNVGYADWCRLAYQFGHELGHVLCNSWQFSAKPQPPTQWLEEVLVETFSVRGLRLLTGSWERSPPFAGDAGFARAIRQYGSALLDKFKADDLSPAEWFRTNRTKLEARSGKEVPWGPAVVGVLHIYEDVKVGKPACLDDLGALNRWPERTSVPIERYLDLWTESCVAIGSTGELPSRLRQLFAIG
ncbi:hypothetical protein [Bradyrhizobium sp. RD5-C2]|uniref:hypothetical protein n=1 Tax=Bradyrhizobium sp. RD5-C2 TaxID=244562 RepID=UPI001CC49817|nr:hypothetical protein [Bradyrhizobium sp. RD5-C2]GIQ71980.1 hypothetical protein BraRD5C2_04160 [Bradyrhizobium sp. RD5-C2]